MSNNEAKFLLNAYRPNGADATDPSLAGALQQAKADPMLEAWFAREQAHATIVTERLRQIAPPAGLRDAILAGARASERTSTPARPSRIWVWAGLGLAAAAAILLVFGLVGRRERDDRTLVDFAMNDVLHGRHGGRGAAEQRLETELGQADAHLAGGLPVDFNHLTTTGCRTLSVAGHDVLEVCFTRSGAEFHCYIARKGDFDRRAAAQFVQQGALSAVTWITGNFRYVVVGDSGLDRLKQLL